MTDHEEWGEGRFEDDWLNDGFVTFPVVLLFDTQVSGGAKATYGAICWHIWRNGKVPPQTELAQELGGGVRTIKRHLAELEDAGYIDRIQHGLGRPNSYIIKSLSSRGPKMALLEGHQWHFKRANNGPQSMNLDFTTQTQQQQSLPETVVAFQTPTAQALNDRLTALGVAKSTANKLVKEHDAIAVYRWVCYTEHRLQSGWVPKETPAAWLVSAIRSEDWVIPDWFRTPEEQAAEKEHKQRVTKAEQRNREEAARQERQAAEAQRLAIEQELGIGERTRAVWQQTIELLQERGQMSPALLSAFLLPLEDSKATIVTPVKFFGKVISQNADTIQAALEEVAGESIEGIQVKHVELERAGSD